jgi:hypothetical protein
MHYRPPPEIGRVGPAIPHRSCPRQELGHAAKANSSLGAALVSRMAAIPNKSDIACRVKCAMSASPVADVAD